jgi:TetR/AcrR family transcriptional repressor of nem operon
MKKSTQPRSDEGVPPPVDSLPAEPSPAGRNPAELRERRRQEREQEREEAKKRTRHALMAAGLDAIIESGLDVGLADICERAGYSRGAFYGHFRDRQDFLVSITEWMFSAMIDSLISDQNAPDDLLVSAQRFTHALSTGQWPLIPRIRVAAVRLMDALSRWPKIRASFDRFTAETIERMQHGATAGQKAGLVRSDLDPNAIGAMLMIASMGAIILHNVGLSIDYKQQAETLLRMMSPKRTPTPDAKEEFSRASEVR